MAHLAYRTKPDNKLQITRSVLAEIRKTLGGVASEQGGVLGGSREDGIVRYFYFDHSAQRTGITYTPDHTRLNQLFKNHWNPKGINLLGFVHSHPPGARHPSPGDLVYACAILKAIPDLAYLLLPIVMTEPDTGQFKILGYAAMRDGDDVRVEELDLVLVDDDKNFGSGMHGRRSGSSHRRWYQFPQSSEHATSHRLAKMSQAKLIDRDDMFDCHCNTYGIDRAARCHIMRLIILPMIRALITRRLNSRR
jgi:proteasome lid subunit RPN8/RPN11